MTHGTSNARPVTTDEAKTKILRRPSLSESGPGDDRRDDDADEAEQAEHRDDRAPASPRPM